LFTLSFFCRLISFALFLQYFLSIIAIPAVRLILNSAGIIAANHTTIGPVIIDERLAWVDLTGLTDLSGGKQKCILLISSRKSGETNRRY
jgi:hypothetical protein